MMATLTNSAKQSAHSITNLVKAFSIFRQTLNAEFCVWLAKHFPSLQNLENVGKELRLLNVLLIILTIVRANVEKCVVFVI